MNNNDNQIIIKKEDRNYGIDLLRLFSMFLVVILHCLGQGGILKNAIPNSYTYKFFWFLEILAYCAVNIFGLISGYVYYSDKEKEFKLTNYIKIWMEVVFYGILITFLFHLKNPALVSKKDYIITLFPVTNGLYWYFTAYTGLFIITPFLNKAIRNCNKEFLKKTFLIILLVFSIFNTIAPRFILNSGYSFIWLVLLYILGAIIKKCEIGKKLKPIQIILSILILCIITYLYKIYGFSGEFLNIAITKGLLVSYTSPTILGCAILYLIGFSKIKFNHIFQKIIKFTAPSAFSIYLINNHKMFWNNVMKDLFANYSNQAIHILFLNVICFSVIFAITSIIIDQIRLCLFKLFKVHTISEKISQLVKTIINKISLQI